MASLIAGTDNGLWLLGTEQHPELDGRRVSALAGDESTLWAVVDEHTIQRRGADGAWTNAAQLDALGINCVLPRGAVMLAGTYVPSLSQCDTGEW